MLKHILPIAIFISCGILQSCNSAPVGFFAPQGSSISTGSDLNVESATGGLALVTFTVLVPQSRVEIEATSETVEQVPGNGIYIQIWCSGGCVLYDRAPGEDSTVLDLARLQAVTDPYEVETNSSGSYTVVALLPAPSDFAQTSYTAEVYADIGVSSTSAVITVTQPSGS